MATKKPERTLETMLDDLVKQTVEDEEADGYQVLGVVGVKALLELGLQIKQQTAAMLTLTQVFETQVTELIAALDDLRLGPEEPDEGPETPPG